jgi:ABC-type nitrate/sulfonate/bicarbonate transport system substrate-binding protein
MQLSRRKILQTSLASTGLGALGAPIWMPSAHAQVALQVGLSWVSNVEYAGLWVALEKGFFREEGLAVQAVPGGPNAPPPLVGVAAGKLQIGYTNWFPFLDAVAKNNDFVLVGVTFPISPLGILSLAAKPIRKPADLVGAKLLVQGPNERAAIDAVLTMAGLPKTVQYVQTGFSPEPLLSKQGDGYTAFVTNQAVTLERMGLQRDKDFFFASFDELGYRTYSSCLFTSRSYLQSNRAQVVGFMKGLTRGWQEAEKDPAYASGLAVSKYGVDLGLDARQQQRQSELQLPLLRRAGSSQRLLMLDRQAISGPMYTAARAAGRSELPAVETITDISVMEEVYRSIGAPGARP